MFALTATAVATSACGGETATGGSGGTPGDAASETASGADDGLDAQGVQAIYGAPAGEAGPVTTEPTDAGTGVTDADLAYDGPMAVAAYGIQPFEDGGFHGVAPPYGAFPGH
jgi:hypothetical protein